MTAPDDPLERFTNRARQVIARAQRILSTSDDLAGPRDILISLLENGGEGIWEEALRSLGVETRDIRAYFQPRGVSRPGAAPSSGPTPLILKQLSRDAKQVIALSLREATMLGQDRVDCEALLLGLISQRGADGGQVLIGLGADLERTRREVVQLLRQPLGGPVVAARHQGSDGFRGCLDRNLSQAAVDDELDLVIGREREIEQIMQVLSRRTPSSPVLIGEPGVGKTAVVHGLAQRISRGEAPARLTGAQIWTANVYRFERLKPSPPRIPKNVIGLVEGIGRLSPSLLGMLDRALPQVIWTAEPDSFGKTMGSKTLRRTLVPVHIGNPDPETIIQILMNLRTREETHHNVTITDAALRAIARITCHPPAAIDLLGDAASLGSIRGLSKVDEGLAIEAAAAGGFQGYGPGALEAPLIQAPTGEVEHDPEIWEMS